MPMNPQGHEDGFATKDTKITEHEHEGARRFPPIPAGAEAISSQVIGAAIEVHRGLGPGFVEKIYMEALCLELHERRMRFERERAVAVWYRGVAIPGQRST
jgi:hypothetical protein